MPEANMFMEKRIHPRVSIKIPVKYRVIEDQKSWKRFLSVRRKNKRLGRWM